MKWVVGALVLAVVGAVSSGRVPMQWVVYSFGALFASLGGALMFAWYRSKHPGMLLMGIVYFASALAALSLNHWWPLVVGFGVAWILRVTGMDPAPEDVAPELSQQPGVEPPSAERTPGDPKP